MLLLKNEAENFGIGLSEGQLAQFKKYKRLLLEYNEKFNLTAITDDEGIELKHFLDSLTLLTANRLGKGASVTDIGAGAGFPSVPLKIARPDLKITMLDSLSKRVDFLNTVASELELEKTEVLHIRAEDAGRGWLRESFDAAVARAVADLSVLAEYALPLVKVGGCFIAMKGSSPEDEINSAKPAIKAMGGRIEEVKEVYIPRADLHHTLVIIKKEAKTPSKYPRKAGKPAKEPIK